MIIINIYTSNIWYFSIICTSNIKMCVAMQCLKIITTFDKVQSTTNGVFIIIIYVINITILISKRLISGPAYKYKPSKSFNSIFYMIHNWQPCQTIQRHFRVNTVIYLTHHSSTLILTHHFINIIQGSTNETHNILNK